MSEFMKRVGFRVVQMINEQIQKGIDAEGKPYAYSTKPFVRPMGGLRVKAQKQLIKDGKLKPFTTKGGSKWVLVTGGYKSLREMRGQRSDGDFLQETGQMLRSLQPIKATGNEVIIGFNSAKEAEKAFWLNISGAGKGKKKWKFMGLTKENQEILAKETGVIIAQDFERTGQFLI